MSTPFSSAKLGAPGVATVINGQSPPSSAYNDAGDGLPFFQGKADFGAVHPVPRVWATEGPKRAIAGDVLISVRAPVVDVNLATADCVIGRGLAAIRSGEQFDRWFLYFALQHLKPVLDQRATGSTFASVNSATLEDLDVPAPPHEEQRAMGSMLQAITQHVAQETVLVEATRSLKRATIGALFSRGLKGETQRETEIGLVPATWAVVEFGAVREWLQYGTSVRCTYDTPGFPVLRIPNIESVRVNATDLKYGVHSAGEAARYRLEPGDLLFIRTNGVLERLGTCAVFEGEPAGALFASYLIRARLNTERVDPRFVAYFLGSAAGTALIAGRATPAADGKYNMNTGTIDRLPIPLPPSLEEQREIVTVLDALDRKIELHHRKRVVLDELFQALLHKLMTGEIRVADLNLDALSPARAEVAVA